MVKIRQGGFLITKIHQLSGRIISKKLKSCNIEEINQAQGRILFFLWQNDGISIQEVSKMTSLGKSTLTSMLDRLETAGQIERIQSRDDRRKILIKVKNKNESIRSVYEQVIKEMSSLYYKGFSEKEITIFENDLERVFKNLSEHEEV